MKTHHSNNIFDLAAIQTYRTVVVPLALLGLLIGALFHSKIRATLKLRTQKMDWPIWIGQSPTIWIHAASGEFEYAKPVIQEWKRRHPEYKIVVSYFSPSFKTQIQKSALVDFSFPLPFDLTSPLLGLILKVRPKCVLISRTDLWPNFLYLLREKGIPRILFSATRPQNPYPKWIARILYWPWSLLSQVYTVSNEDADNLIATTPHLNTLTLGDSRFDQVFLRLQENRKLNTEFIPQIDSLCLVAGSTWPEDEAILLPATTELIKDGQIRLIIAPHEPTENHLHSIQDWIKFHGLTSRKTSEEGPWTENVLLVDQVGLLAELYQFGDFAFVGGSYRQSTHSVMEPLAAGLPVLVGPKIQKNREALHFLNKNIWDQYSRVHSNLKNGFKNEFKIVQCLEGLQDWSLALEQMIENLKVQMKTDVKLAIIQKIKAHQGASQRICDEVEKQL